MSKASRRRQRPGTSPSTPRPASAPPPTGTGSTPASKPQSADAAAASVGATAGTTAGVAGGTGTSTGTQRAPGTPSTSRPSSTRVGRRERQRAYVKPTFFQRYRTAIIVVAALAGVALLSTFVFLSASQPAYACSTQWTPNPTASPAAGATPALGNVQPDMGRQHVAVGDKVTYTYCAPATGNHFNRPGTAGPIPARMYGPGDNVLPQGWLHNLEHGGIVILYRGDSAGATPEGQAQLRALYDSFPNSPVCSIPKGEIAPVIARFDQMSSPFQAIVWGRVLLLDAFDQAKILAFYEQWGERTNPEKQCAPPSASPAGSAAPSASASAAPSATAVPSASSSAAPSSAAPSSSN
ncbi:MAG: DUF3105 domain-containing protein [Chloroflexota bacterium]